MHNTLIIIILSCSIFDYQSCFPCFYFSIIIILQIHSLTVDCRDENYFSALFGGWYGMVALKK